MAAEDRGPEIAAVAILFLTLTLISVGLRCYVRTILIKGFGLDDWFAVASLILFTLYCTFVLRGVQYGTGQHLINIPPRDIPIALKWWWCCELAYIASTAVFKTSICIFLARICITRTQLLTLWVVGIVVNVYSIIFFFIVVFQCSPVEYFWTQYLSAKGHCINPSIILGTTYTHSAISCLADWTLATLPVFLVWNLSLNSRTKISVAFVLALGAFGSTATIVRIPYIKQLSQSDFLYSTADVAIWSTVEPGMGITASAIATLRPLFRTFLSRSRLFGSSRTGHDMPTWPSRMDQGAAHLRKISRNGYGEEETGFRNDIGMGAGNTTTIISTTNRTVHGQSGLGSLRGQKQQGASRGHNRQLGDSSDEFLPLQKPGCSWVVEKTTRLTREESPSGGNGR